MMTAKQFRDNMEWELMRAAAALIDLLRDADAVLDELTEKIFQNRTELTTEEAERVLLERVTLEMQKNSEFPIPTPTFYAQMYKLFGAAKKDGLLPYEDVRADVMRILTAMRRMKKRPGFRKNSFSDTCSVCGRTICRDMNFCSSCGQAIDLGGGKRDEDG